jgi:hypothetical protein
VYYASLLREMIYSYLTHTGNNIVALSVNFEAGNCSYTIVRTERLEGNARKGNSALPNALLEQNYPSADTKLPPVSVSALQRS